MGPQTQGTMCRIKCVHYVMALLILIPDDNDFFILHELRWIHMGLQGSLDTMGKEFFIRLPPQALNHSGFEIIVLFKMLGLVIELYSMLVSHLQTNIYTI